MRNIADHYNCIQGKESLKGQKKEYQEKSTEQGLKLQGYHLLEMIKKKAAETLQHQIQTTSIGAVGLHKVM